MALQWRGRRRVLDELFTVIISIGVHPPSGDPGGIHMHTHPFTTLTLPQRQFFFSFCFPLLRLFPHLSRLLGDFSCLLFKTLRRNIFVLGPAQLCIFRNDDGSYDVTVLVGGRGSRSSNRGNDYPSRDKQHEETAIFVAFLSTSARHIWICLGGIDCLGIR